MTLPSPSTTVCKTCAPTGSTIATLGTTVYPCPRLIVLIDAIVPSDANTASKDAVIGFEPIGGSTYIFGGVEYPNPGFTTVKPPTTDPLEMVGVASVAPPG